MNKCVRIYANRDYRIEMREPGKVTDDWLYYNQVFRFGNALFINGKFFEKGYFKDEAEAKQVFLELGLT